MNMDLILKLSVEESLELRNNLQAQRSRKGEDGKEKGVKMTDV